MVKRLGQRKLGEKEERIRKGKREVGSKEDETN
jgi:hypothetical protein